MNEESAYTVTRRGDTPIAEFTIARPGRANALSHEVLDGLIATLRRLPAGCDALLIAGSAAVFSAGADLGCVAGKCGDSRAVQSLIDELIETIETAPYPVAALYDGPCVGAAVEISLACDVRLATARGSLRIPATEIGTIYRPEGLENLSRRLPPLALQSMLLMGNRIPARLAQSWGLLEVFDDADSAIDELIDTVARINRKPGTFAGQKASLRTLLHTQQLPEQARLVIAGIRNASKECNNDRVKVGS
ncbi:enoyl-CoA hydratase/isomerase family protein [Mycolicibacterium farcinogenes]|uniref:enoyl-CoA hydratase/isomerase family protein n=1 Tax=Mycolicibacterium farcinogenes TaxID=1802 RepID=UPI001C8D31DF|nr:enoyl-CoA hydratase/isomerase family protein [Mycolicibacterium farcinogenes]QZH60905.1 enoyl-CoA hydratase/isomerase family protein [Mycolicibacterium farcinogenes]